MVRTLRYALVTTSGSASQALHCLLLHHGLEAALHQLPSHSELSDERLVGAIVRVASLMQSTRGLNTKTGSTPTAWETDIQTIA